MNIFDLSEKDKINFKCYKFNDNSVYYGEVGWVDHLNNIVKTKQNKIQVKTDDFSREMFKTLRCVRHGEGVQIFEVNENNFLCKYEGEWQKDKKHGRGNCYYSDKSYYEGYFINDVFEGSNCKYTWANGDSYLGDWKNGKMEGEGNFIHHDGHNLKGKFKNNYYFDKERWINPFLDNESLELFKVKNAEYIKLTKQENEKFNRNNILKVCFKLICN